MTVALIIGSFDPLIQGQVDLITRTAQIAERVVVVIETTPAHKPLYTLEERVKRTEQGLKALQGVEVRTYEGNVAQLVQETGATAYVLALRSAADVDYVNAEIRPLCESLGLELISLLAEPHHAFVTTALVRDVARLGGDITPFVP